MVTVMATWTSNTLAQPSPLVLQILRLYFNRLRVITALLCLQVCGGTFGEEIFCFYLKSNNLIYCLHVVCRMWHLFSLISCSCSFPCNTGQRDDRPGEYPWLPIVPAKYGLRKFVQWRYSVFQVEHQSVCLKSLTPVPNKKASVLECWLNDRFRTFGKWKWVENWLLTNSLLSTLANTVDTNQLKVLWLF